MLFLLLSNVSLAGESTSPSKTQVSELRKHRSVIQISNKDLVQTRDERSEFIQMKSLVEPGPAEIYAWALAEGIPVFEIDPTLIDTNEYAGWYAFWTEVPLSNDIIPLLVGDIDRNGLPEVYGSYKDSVSTYETRAYEIDSTGLVSLLYNYMPRPGVARQFANADMDSLEEVTFTLGGLLSDYEQSIPSEIPTNLNFQHQRYQSPVSPGFTGIFIGMIDEDTMSDFLYKGSEGDSTSGIGMIYIAEYEPDSNNFIRVWSRRYVLTGHGGVAGFSVDDFDSDGRNEFVISDLFGSIWVTENDSDNAFSVTWEDSIPLVNLYYHGSGDVDGDGRPEFYVGATLSSGNWTTVYEADSNNSYSPKLVFHLLSGGTFDNPTYLVDDFEGDGSNELLIFSGVDLYVFKSDEDNQYRLWYYKREDSKESIQLYDFNQDNRKDFIISKAAVNQQGQVRYYATVYLASTLVDVRQRGDIDLPDRFGISQNYPNPFNSVTRFEYFLSRRERVRLVIYDLLGSKVEVLVDRQHDAGIYSFTWNAINWPTGLYFYRFETPTWVVTKKMLLIR